MVLDTISQILHVLFAGLWIGSIFFATLSISEITQNKQTIKRLEWFSRLSIVVLFITGGHLAGVRYTFNRLFYTFQGNLVIMMLVLWAVLAGLVEISTKKAKTEDASNLFKISSVVGIILLIIGGTL